MAGFMDNVKSMFGKKPEPDQNSLLKEQAHKNRLSGEGVVLAIREVQTAIKKSSKIKDEGVRQNLQLYFATLANALDNAEPISQCDVTRIDEYLTDIAGACREAILNGEIESVKLGVTYFKQTLVEYRRDLAHVEMKKKEEIMKNREERVRCYARIVENTQKKVLAEIKIDRKKRELVEKQEQYRGDYEESETLKEKYPAIIEALGKGEIPDDPAAHDIIRAFNNLGRLNNEIMESAAFIGVDLRTMDQLKSNVQKFEASLAQLPQLLTGTDVKEIAELQRKMLESVLAQERILKQLEEAELAHATAVQEWIDSEGNKERALSAVMIMEELVAKEKRKQEVTPTPTPNEQEMLAN